MKKNSLIALLSFLIVLMASCTSSRPSYVLSNGEMEDVLYDIHRAHFIQEQHTNGNNGAMQYALFLHVLQQHDVTQAEWDSSMVYYTRHANELEGIYSSVMERLDSETSAMGAGVSEADDSTDIWKADRHILLTTDMLNASYQWKLNADTLVKPGEKINIRFNALFLNQNAERHATALIAIRLKNDSVIVRQQSLSQTSISNIEVTDDKIIGIKSISGLFMLHPGSTLPPSMNYGMGGEQNNTVPASQVLIISDIKLLHEDINKERQEQERRDSVNTDNHPDSIKPQQHDGPGSAMPHRPDGPGHMPPPQALEKVSANTPKITHHI